MTQISAVHSRLFKNALHVQFATEIKDTTTAHNPAALKIQSQYDDLVLWFDRENNAFNYARKSELSIRKADVDNERDLIYTGIYKTVKGLRYHYDPQLVATAGRLLIVLDSYNREQPLTQLSYDAETAAVTRLLQELTRRSDDVKQAGIDGWVQALEAKNNEFETLVKQSIAEKTAKPPYNLRQARQGFENALHTLFACVNTLNIMESSDAFTAYITDVNALIKHYNDILAQHQGVFEAAKKKKETNPE